MEVIGELHALVTSPLEKSLWYPLDKRPGGPQSWFRCGDEEKKISAPARN